MGGTAAQPHSLRPADVEPSHSNCRCRSRWLVSGSPSCLLILAGEAHQGGWAAGEGRRLMSSLPVGPPALTQRLEGTPLAPRH